jgi:predicted transcriptional regulator
MEELGEVFFLLSNSDRMKLLADIKGGDLRLTDLAARLSATVQETSKHLGRLSEGGLIVKGSSGSYRLTSFGKLVSDLLPSLGFVSQYRDYFLSHDLSSIPQEFVLRVGELSDHSYVNHVTNVLTECQHLLGMADDYFHWIVDQPLPWSINKPIPDHLSVELILQTDVPAPAYQLARTMLGAKAQVRFADRVSVSVAVNEKMAGICFPDLHGKTDFSCGFIGYGAGFQKWCADLFDYFWENSRKTRPSSEGSQFATSRELQTSDRRV